MKTIKLLFLFFIFTIHVFSQTISINKIEPPNWWSGMKLNKIQLMVYGENLGEAEVISENEGIKI